MMTITNVDHHHILIRFDENASPTMLTFCEKSSGAILMKNLMKIWWKWIISDLCDIILQISVLADATPSRQNRRKHTNVGKSFKIIRLIWISTQYPQSEVLVVIGPSGLSLECLFANLCNCVKTAIFWLFCLIWHRWDAEVTQKPEQVQQFSLRKIHGSRRIIQAPMWTRPQFFKGEVNQLVQIVDLPSICSNCLHFMHSH